VLCICETRRSEDLWRDFSGNREIRAIVAVFISPGRCRRAASPFHSIPLFSPFLLLLHITVASSCQSRRNWLRRVPKILRGTREYEWGTINQSTIFDARNLASEQIRLKILVFYENTENTNLTAAIMLLFELESLFSRSFT